MSKRENISYLVPRDPSIKCWEDRVKLSGPRTKNLIQLGLDEIEETMGDKIKVYLRLKPSSFVGNPYTVLNSSTLKTEAPKDSVSYKNVTNGIGKLMHKFTFTSILDQDVTQADLFKKCAVKSLKKFFNGENYLLMAYGTTSAGKTFTMQGNVDQPGVIPRALDFVFSGLKNNLIQRCKYHPHQYNELIVLSEEQLKKNLNHKNFILSLDLTKCQKYPEASQMTMQTNSSSGFSDMYENVTFKEMQSHLADTESLDIESTSYKYSVWISMVEIYNEQIYDLLELPNEKGVRSKLTFRDDECGNTFVKTLRYVNVSSGHEAFQILQFGRSNLHLAPTALNESSSRSHCIFTITLAKFFDYDSSSYAMMSKFSFCDLAGIERAKKTLNMKDRLIESKAINTSLSILVKCMTTIKENQNNKEQKIIPYRESKLTKLFRDAVTGKEQFSLIVNVTTEPNLFDETLNVLKFSALAQKIVPQNVFVKPKMLKPVKKTRFSQLVTNSSYNTKAINWDSLTTDEDIKPKEENTSEIEDLRDLVEKLKDELSKERKKCEKIESDIREELTSKFSEILEKQRDNNQIRLENERERIEEMYEKREKRLVKYYEIIRGNKRPKLDEDESFEYEDREKKLKEAQEEIEVLNSKNSALKEEVQEFKAQQNNLVIECSTLKFTIAEKDRMIEEMKRTIEAKEAGGNALEVELREQLEDAKIKIADFKNLLDEAALNYKELDENNKYLRNENEALEQALAEQRDAVSYSNNELVELQKLLSQKRIMIEKLEDANEELESVKTEKEVLSKEKKLLEEKCGELNSEVKILQKEIKDLIAASKNEEKLEKERELLELNEKLNTQIEDMKIRERATKIIIEDLKAKLDAAESQNNTMKTLKDEAEVQTLEIPRLREEIEKLKKDVEKKEKDLTAFNEIRDLHQKEVAELKEENENLLKEILLVKESVSKRDSVPVEGDKSEVKRLKEFAKEKVEKTENVKMEVEEGSAGGDGESDERKEEDETCVLTNSSDKEDSPPEGGLKKEANLTPHKLSKEMESLSLRKTQAKSTRKKVDLLEETVHPSTVKHTNKGKKKNKKGVEKGMEKEKEKEKEMEKEIASSAKKKGKCYKKLFMENDFDELLDLNGSPVEEIPRLRPRK